MPDVRNCKRCGRVYNYIGGAPLCPACREKDEEDFKIVKEYLYKNPGASVSEVSDVLDIAVEKIKRFLKEGRLEIVGEDGNMFLECENCGKAIRTGRFCNECEKELKHDFQSTAINMNNKILAEEKAKESKFAMRYLNKNDNKGSL